MHNYIFKNQNKKSIFLHVIILCLLVTFFSMLAASTYTERLDRTVLEYINAKNNVFGLNDFSQYGYAQNNNHIISTTDDPMLVLNSELGEYVSTITIHLNSELNKDITAQVYYTTANGSDFNGEEVLSKNISSGSKEFQITVDKEIKKLRIDLGTEQGLEFDIKSININEASKASNLSNLLKILCASILNSGFKGIWLDRFAIFFFAFLFLGLHFIVNIKCFYEFLFRKRWYIALFMLLYVVVNKYNGDSLTLYDSLLGIQKGQGSEYIEPVLGVARSIRSDEWIVNSPSELSAQFGEDKFGKYNYIMRGTKTLNSVLGINTSFYTLGKNPFQYAYSFLDVERAYSFNWYAPIILLFVVLVELFLIISNRKKLLSVTGAILIVASSFYLWWDFPIHFLASNGAIVCCYYYLDFKEKWKKLLCGLGVAISASVFITNIYPAWQVPLGYITLAFLFWLIHDNWNKIKLLDKKDWCIFGISGILLVVLVTSYFYNTQDYFNAITQTVYPGKRSVNGGFALNKLFYYAQAVMYPYKDIGNPSEAGVFLSLFPIPFITIIILWFRNKRKDWLVTCLLVVTALLTLYSTIELPGFLAKITLLSYSMPERCVDMVGYLQIFFIIIIFSRFEGVKKISSIAAVIIGTASAVMAILVSNKYYPGYLSEIYISIFITIIALLGYCVMTATTTKLQNFVLISLIGLSIITGIAVRPIEKGLDTIYSKPVAKKIEEITKVDSQGKWLAYGGGFILPAFTVACGAPTINSVNMYPNLELWETLDKNNEFEDVYNRYAHINLNFKEGKTSMELFFPDQLILNLSYNDIVKTEAKYILSLQSLDNLKLEDANIALKLIYMEDSCYIYEIVYF